MCTATAVLTLHFHLFDVSNRVELVFILLSHILISDTHARTHTYIVLGSYAMYYTTLQALAGT